MTLYLLVLEVKDNNMGIFKEVKKIEKTREIEKTIGKVK